MKEQRERKSNSKVTQQFVERKVKKKKKKGKESLTQMKKEGKISR
ncbi:hypothetical protein [Klebsiella pneumoniae]